MSDRLRDFFSTLNARLEVTKAVRHEIDKKFSPDFNLFCLLLRDELSLSSFLRELLDDKSYHGQKNLFRMLFLSMIKEKYSSNKIGKLFDALGASTGVSVDTEVQTIYSESSQRRMDILIHNKDYGLMIENKPWAGDQNNQLHDYMKDLQVRFKGNFFIIYLSPQGSPPSEYSIEPNVLQKLKEEQRFCEMSFRHDVAQWVRKCAEKSESEKMRSTLFDFANYLLLTF